jgi:nitrite reductase (NADH) small subunit
MAHWINVCKASDLLPDSGVCALVEGQQVAIFHLPKEGALYAIHNYDPIGKANVLSRGIVGDIQGEPVVASPLYKQHFSLLTGQCLEDETINVPVFLVRVIEGRVEIGIEDKPASVNHAMETSA